MMTLISILLIRNLDFCSGKSAISLSRYFSSAYILRKLITVMQYLIHYYITGGIESKYKNVLQHNCAFPNWIGESYFGGNLHQVEFKRKMLYEEMIPRTGKSIVVICSPSNISQCYPNLGREKQYLTLKANYE